MRFFQFIDNLISKYWYFPLPFEAKIIVYIIENYVNPSQIHAREAFMLLKSLPS